MTEYGFPVFTLCSVVLDLLPLTQDVSGTQGVGKWGGANNLSVSISKRKLNVKADAEFTPKPNAVVVTAAPRAKAKVTFFIFLLLSSVFVSVHNSLLNSNSKT